ncbi:MAG: tetratricopeptide repeat protein [Gammaproteobacteria bacterium]|nr:tetratricopeptide repeat protein [Gammaproteobacteria bacterium]
MVDTLASPYIHAADADTFNALVLDNSQQGPVLVNFWSKKAGPCLRQYPILDKLIHHYNGKVLLVNVDTEQEVAVTKDYGIASVPTLKLFRHGQAAVTLHGYQSEEELIKLLDRFVTRESDLALAQAIRRYSEGKAEDALALIAEAIVADPVNPRLPLAMAKLLKHQERYHDALVLLKALPAEILKNTEIASFRDRLTFYVEADFSHDLTALLQQQTLQPHDNSIKQQLVAHYVITQQYDLALAQLATIMEQQPGFNANYAQQAMLRVFNIIGREHPLVARYRDYLKRYSH